jgi:hypothetical protein
VATDSTVAWKLNQERMSRVEMSVVHSLDMREVFLIGIGEVVIGDKVNTGMGRYQGNQGREYPNLASF